MNDSKELQYIKESGKGYYRKRNNAHKIRTLYKSLHYEIAKKGNTAILTYARDHYRFPLWDVAEKIYENDHGPGSFRTYCISHAKQSIRSGFALSFDKIVLELILNHGSDFTKELVYHIQGIEKRALPYTLWLNTEQNLRDRYNDSYFDISLYRVPENSFVIYDGGQEGILFALHRLDKV